MQSGTNNVFIGKGSGSAVTKGGGNIIIGSYPGTATLEGSVVISNAAGKVLTQWDAAGNVTQLINDASKQTDPTANGTMVVGYDPKTASLRYRVRDANGVLRTLDVSAAPPVSTIGVRPLDVTRTTGEAVLATWQDPATTAGVPAVQIGHLPDVPPTTRIDSSLDFVLYGVPAWAGNGLLGLRFTVHCAVAFGPLDVNMATADGAVYTGSVPAVVAGDSGADTTVEVVFATATTGMKTGADGRRRPALAPTFGALSTQPVFLNLKSATVPHQPIFILGMDWYTFPDLSRGWMA